MAKRSRLTHLDARRRPTMVDVGEKEITHRTATAEARVYLPRAVLLELRRTGHRTKKGPVFDTAIIAGVLAAKRTAELIPFCHPLPLENCTVQVEPAPRGLRILCTVSVHHRTGVEMEALTGAFAAALTVYDMCKALSHDIEISTVRLLAKSGGRRDFARGSTRSRRRPYNSGP
jgi:cyclic pyranopterin monophosphate synthase